MAQNWIVGYIKESWCEGSLMEMPLCPQVTGGFPLERYILLTLVLIYSNGGQLQDIPYFYNTEALHDLVVKLFFKVRKARKEKGKISNTQRAPSKYKPEFPFASLVMVVGMVSIFTSFMPIINYSTSPGVSCV